MVLVTSSQQLLMQLIDALLYDREKFIQRREQAQHSKILLVLIVELMVTIFSEEDLDVRGESTLHVGD